ncbi:hypothetical protein ACSSS7_005034 [Eimeria intestinalis]
MSGQEEANSLPASTLESRNTFTSTQIPAPPADGFAQSSETRHRKFSQASSAVISTQPATVSAFSKNQNEGHEQQQPAQSKPILTGSTPGSGSQKEEKQAGTGGEAPGLTLSVHSSRTPFSLRDHPQSAALSTEQDMQKQEEAESKTGGGQQQLSSPSTFPRKSSDGASLTSTSANSKSGSPASFLDAFHRRQRTEVSREQQRRSEALSTLKHWRGGGASRQSDAGSNQQLQKAAAASAGPPRRVGNGDACRSRVVDEMVALFSSLSLSKHQRAALSCKQTIAQLEQQQKQVTELLGRLQQPATAPKARGALVKARSYQLQMQQQQGQRPAAQHRRLPPHMLLPLPSLCSNGSSSRRDNDPWRRLLKRVRGPPRRRASLPSFVGRRRGTPNAAADGAAPGVNTPRGAPPAAEAYCASHNAAAAAAATFAEEVESCASSHRTASEGWRTPRRGPSKKTFLGGSHKKSGELLQQAEGACLAALADADGVSRQLVTRALEVLGRVLKHQKMICEQRLEVAALLEARKPSRGVSTPLLLDTASNNLNAATASFPPNLLKSRGSDGGASGRIIRPMLILSDPTAAAAGAPAAAGAAAATAVIGSAAAGGDDELNHHELLRLSSGGSLLDDSWAEDLYSLKDLALSRKDTLSLPPSGSDYAEEDTSLLDAETDCEYLLGRQLLPYERVLLKYRMLRRSTGGVPSMVRSEGDDTADARLVDQLLLAVEDGGSTHAPGGELWSGREEEEDLWCLTGGGSKHADKADQIEQLLGLVGELQQADMHQESLIQRTLLFSKQTSNSKETASALRAFFNGGEEEQKQQTDGQGTEIEKADMLGGSATGGTTTTATAAAAGIEESSPSLSVEKNAALENVFKEESVTFPSAQRLYRAHYLLGPWRDNFTAPPPPPPPPPSVSKQQ